MRVITRRRLGVTTESSHHPYYSFVSDETENADTLEYDQVLTDLFETLADLFNPVLFNRQAALIVDGRQKDRDPLVCLEVVLNHTDQGFPWAIFNSHFIARFQILPYLDKALAVYARLKQRNHVVINRSWLVVETHYSMDSPGKADLVKGPAQFEAGKNVSRKQGLRHERGDAGKWIASRLFDLRIETLDAPRL